MKEWKSPSAAVFMAETDEWEGLSEEREEKGRDIRMPELQLRELENFKGRYKDVLSDTSGRTNLVCHNISTGDAPPVRLPPYRLAHKFQEVLREETQTLLNQGIIRPSTSPWSAPIVLVPKKDNTKKMCVDYHKLMQSL